MLEDNALPDVEDDGLVISTAGDSTETETPIEAAELAPAPEAEPEIQQESESDKAQKAINKKTWQFHEEKRRADALERELTEERAKGKPVEAPKVPSLPDPYSLSDEEYRQQMTERDNALARKAEYDATQRYQAESTRRQQEEAQSKRQTEAANIRTQYTNRAAEAGLDVDEVLSATADIVNYGISDAVAEMIATEADGPQLAMWLRQNPTELQSLQSMPIYKQIDTLKAVQLKSSKTKTSKAPPPPTQIRSGGAVSREDDLLAGATFTTF